MSVFNPYKVSREKHTSRAFHFENDKDQLTSVARFDFFNEAKRRQKILFLILIVSEKDVCETTCRAVEGIYICLLTIYVFQPILELGNVKGWAGGGED